MNACFAFVDPFDPVAVCVVQQGNSGTADPSDFVPHVIHGQKINAPEFLVPFGGIQKPVDQVVIKEILLFSPPFDEAVFIVAPFVKSFDDILSSHGTPPCPLALRSGWYARAPLPVLYASGIKM